MISQRWDMKTRFCFSSSQEPVIAASKATLYIETFIQMLQKRNKLKLLSFFVVAKIK